MREKKDGGLVESVRDTKCCNAAWLWLWMIVLQAEGALHRPPRLWRNAEGRRGPVGSLVFQTFSLPDLLGRAFGPGSFFAACNDWPILKPCGSLIRSRFFLICSALAPPCSTSLTCRGEAVVLKSCRRYRFCG